MPFTSPKHRRYIYTKAGEGETWAKKFVEDADGKVLPKKSRLRKLSQRHQRIATRQQLHP